VTSVTLAIDQGSSSTRCAVLGSGPGAGLSLLGLGSSPVESAFPRSGWVEQDADQIFASVLYSVAGAMAQAEVSWGQVCRIGLAAQTETFVVWDRATGVPVYPAISWRDTRAAELCSVLRGAGLEGDVRRRTGLPLQPAFTAPKLRWLLDHLDGGQRRADAGELLFGDVNCWLLWRLSGSARHVTEPSMAARTMLFSLGELAWDTEMLGLFGIPEQMLPDVGPTTGELAATDPSVCGGQALISATIGDQQAALFGQRCWDAGAAKLTLGTGAFLWCQAGPAPPELPPEGVVSSCAWQLADAASYALEGFVPTAGASTAWLRRLGMLDAEAWPVIRAGALERQAVNGRSGLWCVPAIFGLGTPRWAPIPRADIIGLAAESNAADIAEATMIGVAHQVADAVDAVADGLAGQVTAVRVDGGMSSNESFLQAVADLCGVVLERTANAEATVLGAGALAGLGDGGWDTGQAQRMLLAAASPMQRIEPRLAAASRTSVRTAWQAVLDRSLAGWEMTSQPPQPEARQDFPLQPEARA
jgi:glycerol kinase